MNKIFQIGFNKCGTLSIHHLFEKYTIPKLKCLHWEYGKIGYIIKSNLQDNKNLLDKIQNYQVFSDMECCCVNNNFIDWIFGFKWFYILDKQYPNSKFILNTRNIDNWINSRMKHMFEYYISDGSIRKFQTKKYYYESHMEYYNINSIDKLHEKWKYQWHTHYDNVVNYFANRPDDLLVFDIEKDPFSKFSNFFAKDGIAFKIQRLPHLQKTKETS